MLKAMLRLAAYVDSKINEMNDCAEMYGQDDDYEYPITPEFYMRVVKPDLEVIVEQSDFEQSLQELVPSVSMKELNSYLKLKESFDR